MSSTLQQTPQQTTAIDQQSLWQFFSTLYRYLWVVFLVFISVLSLTIYRNYKAIPIYEATSTVMVETVPSNMGLFSSSAVNSYSYYFGQRNLIQNQILFIRSYMMAQLVAKTFGPEEIAIILKPEKGKKRITLTDEEKVKRFSYLALGSLTVAQQPLTDILIISCRGQDPKIASFLSNSYAKIFQREDLTYRRSTLTSMKDFVEEQLELTKKQLEDTEDQLKAYKMSNNVVYLDAEGQRLINNISSLEVMYFDFNSQLQAARKQITYYQSQISKEKRGFVPNLENLSSPMILSLRSKLVDLEMQKTGLEEKGYSDKHPKVREINSRIAKTSKQLTAELERLLRENNFLDPMSTIGEYIKAAIPYEVQRSGLEARTKALRETINRYNTRLSGFPQKELAIARLTRDKLINEKIYTMLKEQFQTIRISEAGELSRVRIIDLAKEPTAPILPQKKRDLFVGVIFGLILGILMAFFLDYIDDRIRTPEELQRITGYSIIGVIPLISSDRKISKSSKYDLEQAEERLVTHYDPKSPTAEAYRALRTSIIFSRVEKPIKTILITSSGPREGKSTTAANLSITMAQMGSKTLLIDSDLRRPILHSLFGLNKEPGITNILAADTPIEDAIRATSIDNLSVLPAGTMPPNPSELLASKKMDTLLEDLKGMFDIIIFDSPPIIAVTDPIVLGKKVDGICLVVDGYSVKRMLVKRSSETLSKMNLNVLGAIFNKFDLQRRYGYYSYYNYYYYYYSSDIRKDRKRD